MNTSKKPQKPSTIRMQCEAREDYNRRMLRIGRLLAKQTRELKEQAAIIAEKDSALTKQATALAEKDAIIAALQAQLTKQNS